MSEVVHALFSLDLQKLATLLGDVSMASEAFRVQAMIVMFLASFVVAIRCSGAISGERERHTWKVPPLTPLETRHLIRGKLWGIIGASYPYMIAYALPAVGFSILAGPLALIWTLIWLAVTWLAMYYVRAAGIWTSTARRVPGA